MGMRPVLIRQVGAGSTDPVPLNWRKTPFQVTVDCHVEGDATYTVEWTGDDIRDPNWTSGAATWHPMIDIDDATGDAVGTLISPVRAIRLTISEGDGAVEANIISAGN